MFKHTQQAKGATTAEIEFADLATIRDYAYCRRIDGGFLAGHRAGFVACGPGF